MESSILPHSACDPKTGGRVVLLFGHGDSGFAAFDFPRWEPRRAHRLVGHWTLESAAFGF
jgi:hypothetical protein